MNLCHTQLQILTQSSLFTEHTMLCTAYKGPLLTQLATVRPPQAHALQSHHL